MPCNVIRDENGIRAIACSRGRREYCDTCRRPSVALCDFKVKRGGKEATCDRRMCAQHRTNVGPDMDYCPAHARFSAEIKGGAK